MANPEFKYAPMFQLGPDKTEYRLLTKEGVSVGEFEGKEILKVTPEALTRLAQEAFHDVEFKHSPHRCRHAGGCAWVRPTYCRK